MEKFVLFVGAIVLAFVLIVGFSLLFALPVMWLWNCLMPEIFGLTTITFWQALGLNVLSGLLFRSTNTNSSK